MLKNDTKPLPRPPPQGAFHALRFSQPQLDTCILSVVLRQDKYPCRLISLQPVSHQGL